MRKNKLIVFIVGFAVFASQLFLIGSQPASATITGTGLALYYKNDSSAWTTPPAAFTSSTCHTATGNINFNWGSGGPGGSCPNDYFTAYAVGYILAPISGSVTFCEQTDDQFYMNINSTVAIDDNSAKAAATGQNCNGIATVEMVAGNSYPIQAWQHEMGGGAEWRLLWKYSGQDSFIIVPTASLNQTVFTPPDNTAPTITGPSSATGATSSISISENSTSVHTFTANESVTWSKSGTDGSFFTISAGGVVTITSRNFESPADTGGDNTYVVVITATDGASNATSQTLTATITNVNEAPTITINSSNATHAITQAENFTSITTYTATDVDAGASLSFSISGTDAADFAINSLSGVLTFAIAPDFEAPADSDVNNQYVVIITVSDGALSDTQTLTVTITNANESASINVPTVSDSVYKGVATTITVTLNSAGKVRFFVGGKRISNCLARSTTGSYPNFLATCSWKPPVTGRQSLTASITPTDGSFSAATSPSSAVWVNKRANSR
jgi:hypothetical protein